MADQPASRAEYVKALPRFVDAAELIGVDPSGITRAVERLRIQPLRWGGRDKHLTIADVLRIAAVAQRASLEEVAGGLLTWTEREHPARVGAVIGEVDAFFASLPDEVESEPEAFVADLRAALPRRWADAAEAIWRKHADAEGRHSSRR